MKTADVLDKIGSQRARLLQAIEGLGPRAISAPVNEEGWTAKDVLAHLVHWLGQVPLALGAQLQPPPYVTTVKARLSGDEWNARAVDHYRSVSLDEIRLEFEQLAEALVEQVRLRTDDEMNSTGTVAWAGDVPLWQFIAGDTFLHWALHSETIERLW